MFHTRPDYPTLLVVAHDNDCTISFNGRCNCNCTMELLVGDSERWRERKLRLQQEATQ